MTSIQIGVPGAVELTIILLMFAVIGFIAGRWVYRDASTRGSTWAWQWGVAVGLLLVSGLVPGIIAAVIYLLFRPSERN